MPLIHIEGPTDPRIAAYRNLSDAELLRRHGLFVAEGRLRNAEPGRDGELRDMLVFSLIPTDPRWPAMA